MGSIMMHLVVAEEYLKKHKDKDRVEFLRGTIEPDMDIEKQKLLSEADKHGTHYGKRVGSHSIYEAVNTKIDLFKFLKKNEIDTSCNRGKFLHLIFDDMFYRLSYSPEWEEIPVEIMGKEWCYEFDRINHHIAKKYGIKLVFPLPEFILRCLDEPTKYVSLDDFDRFVEVLRGFDLNRAKEEILKDYEGWREKFYKEFGRRPKKSEKII